MTSDYETLQNVRQIRFMFLPPQCTIRVYTLSGTLVKTLEQDSPAGSLAWNLISDWDQALAFGVYVYVVEDPQGKGGGFMASDEESQRLSSPLADRIRKFNKNQARLIEFF